MVVTFRNIQLLALAMPIKFYAAAYSTCRQGYLGMNTGQPGISSQREVPKLASMAEAGGNCCCGESRSS